MRTALVFVENVRRVRLERGMTLEASATEGGIERDQRNPTLSVVERIAQVLNVDSVALFVRQP